MSNVAASEHLESYACPVCDRQIKTKNPRKLFGTPVCTKCRNGFANRRQLGYVIDWTLLMIVFFFGGVLYVLFFGDVVPLEDDSSLSADVLELLFFWVVVPLLFAMKDGFRGYSPGKWVCGVRVVDWETREPISFLQSFKRNLILVVPFMPLVVAFQLVRGRRMGDLWAKTGVIWVKKAHRMPFEPRGILCTTCGYDLTGNVSGRCPECGKDIPTRQQFTRAEVATAG